MINDDGRHAAGHGLLHGGWTGEASRGTASAARARRLLTTLAAVAAVASAWLVSPSRHRRGERAAGAADQRRQADGDGAGSGRQDRGPAHRRAVHRHHGRRSGGRRRHAADRSRDLGPRQEDRHDPRDGLCREPAPCRHLRHRGDLRSLAPRDRDRPGRRPRHQGVVGQRPHHAVGRRAGRGHARPRGDHRAPVRAGDHQHRRRWLRRSRSCSRSASSRPRARPAASSACSGTCSTAAWPPISVRGSRPASLPITAPTSPTNIPVGEVAAGVLSGVSPFGFMLGRMLAGGTTIDVLINALEQRGLVRTLAEPNLTRLSGDTASFLAGGEIPIPVAQSGSSNQITVEWKRYGVGLAFTPTVLNDGLINLKIEPEVSQLDPEQPGPGRRRPAADPGDHRPPRGDHDRAARRPELHDRRPAAERGEGQRRAGSVARQPAGARPAVLQPLLPAAGDRPRHHRHAASGAAGTPGLPSSRRRSTTRCRPTMRTSSSPAMPSSRARDQRALIGHGVPFSGHILDLPKGGTNVVEVRN